MSRRITHLPKPIAIPWFPVGRQITYATVRQLENEAQVKKEVRDLSYWCPSPSFLDTVYAIDFARKRTRMSRVHPVPEDLELPHQQKPTL
ncbi:unnamed protein product [Dicrocoelium dendriticum]|nr:unnamed protein product [Dicrocoelium dendriticum]